MSIAFEDFCLIVAIADTEFNRTPNVEGEMMRILTQLQKNKEDLKRINQTILVSAIYSSQQKDIKEQCKELVQLYHESMKNHVRMERISEHPAVNYSDPEAIHHLLQLYQEIGLHFNETREIIHALCERICGFILRPSCIETGKKAGNPVIQYSGLQQRLSQGTAYVQLMTVVLIQIIREETERDSQTTDRNDLWVLIWQITIEAIILYSNLPQEAPQNEAHLITVLQQSIQQLKRFYPSQFDRIIEEEGFVAALRDLVYKYDTRDAFIKTKLTIVLRMVEYTVCSNGM